MFLRTKQSGEHTYVVIVENQRSGGRVVQRTVARLGRYDDLIATGDLLGIAASAAKLVSEAPERTVKEADLILEALHEFTDVGRRRPPIPKRRRR